MFHPLSGTNCPSGQFVTKSTSLQLSNKNWVILSSFDHSKKILLLLALLYLLLSQPRTDKRRKIKTGNVERGIYTHTRIHAHTHFQAHVHHHERKIAKRSQKIKSQQRSSECKNVRETDQGQAKQQEEKRKENVELTGSTSQESSELQMCTETLGIKCKHSHTQYCALN